MRILLSEGSGLTSRQVAGRLGALGHHVEILSSSRLCLARFTRHVRAVHDVPHFGREPFAWLETAKTIAARRSIDLLFPTQEQVAILAAFPQALGVPTVVPPFAALCRLQDKIAAFRALDEIGVPQPDSVIVTGAATPDRPLRFPLFLKRAVSTASSGVRRVRSQAELARAMHELGADRELLAQAESSGPLAMVQAVADQGRLVAHHANLRVREGVGGGASIKESIAIPELPAMLARLVGALNWHGALALDVIVTAHGPVVIDVNPRLVEPMNAYAAGVDLVGAMLELAFSGYPAARPPGQPGIRTCQLLLALLGAAEHGGTRAAILRELIAASQRRGEYADASEELTPLRGDPIAAIPLLAALCCTLIRPAWWRLFHAGAVGAYALTPDGWDVIRRRVAQSITATSAPSIA